MTDAKKITEINALLDTIGEAIDSGVIEADGYPGTVMLTTDALLDMIDLARSQIAALGTNELKNEKENNGQKT